jgi:bla regulator protein BlaR1
VGAEMLPMLAKATLLSSLAILCVALLRHPLRKLAGYRAAYWIWLLVPAATLTLLLPVPTQLPLQGGVLDGISLSGIVPAKLDAPSSPREWLIPMLLAVWLAGAAASLISLVTRQRRFMRLQGPLVPDERGICIGVAARAPMLIGIFRARIIVPADFESRYAPQEQQLVLAHERAHARRHDILVSALALLMQCVFWFNPLVYLALGWLRHDQELACDEQVLSNLPPTDSAARRVYAAALLKAQLAAESAWRIPIGCHWQSTHPLKERITMLRNPLPGTTRHVAGVLAVLALSSSAGYVAWAGGAVAAGRTVIVDLKLTVTDTATRQVRSAATRHRVHPGEEIKGRDAKMLGYSCTPYLPDIAGQVTDWSPLLERGIPKPIDDEIVLACTIREQGVPVQTPVVIVNNGKPGTIETADAGRQYRLDFTATASPGM